MHSIQWHTLKTQTNQHWSTTRWSLSPTLFIIYISDIPLPPKDVQFTTYADDITIIASRIKRRKPKQLIQPYLNKTNKWATTNNLYVIQKKLPPPFTPGSSEHSTTLSLKLNNQTIPTTKHRKILGVTLDPKLTFPQHINVAITKAKQTLNILKALTSTKWNKQK